MIQHQEGSGHCIVENSNDEWHLEASNVRVRVGVSSWRVVSCTRKWRTCFVPSLLIKTLNTLCDFVTSIDSLLFDKIWCKIEKKTP